MSESPPDKNQIDNAIKKVVEGRGGERPTRQDFRKIPGFRFSDLERHYPGGWQEALEANGFNFPRYHTKLDPEDLLKDWGRVARMRKALPIRLWYKKEGEYSAATLENKFGNWSKIPEEFRRFAEGKPEWADVLLLLPPPVPLSATVSRTLTNGPSSPDGLQIPVQSHQHTKLGGRPTYGDPIDFRGLRHEPVNEQGVVFLFGMVAGELGYMVEAVQTGYPDCEAKRQVAKGQWERVRIEFEFESRNFRDHSHNADECDIIVCWRHNWPDCPKEVVELAKEIKKLPNGG
jgi:hypothetical protein